MTLSHFPLKIGRWIPAAVRAFAPPAEDPSQKARFTSRGTLSVDIYVTRAGVRPRFGGEGGLHTRRLLQAVDAHFGDPEHRARFGSFGRLKVVFAPRKFMPPADSVLDGDGKLQVKLSFPGGIFETMPPLHGVGTLSATVTPRFHPFSEENIERSDRQTPPHCTGCWITLIGGGGGGGIGDEGIFENRGGGGGGGGAAVVLRSFIPRASLGLTYSVTIGIGGLTEEDGTASLFSSGDGMASAGGGMHGGRGTGVDTLDNSLAGSGGVEGPGGVATVVGFFNIQTRDGGIGTHGSPGNWLNAAEDALDMMDGGCPGGGGGGGRSWLTFRHAGGDGGDSIAAAGGLSPPRATINPYGGPGGNAGPGLPGGGGGGASQSPTDDNGYGGGYGGHHGAGGGGGSGGNVAGWGGNGGEGYTLIEWV